MIQTDPVEDNFKLILRGCLPQQFLSSFFGIAGLHFLLLFWYHYQMHLKVCFCLGTHFVIWVYFVKIF